MKKYVFYFGTIIFVSSTFACLFYEKTGAVLPTLGATGLTAIMVGGFMAPILLD